MAVLQVRRGYTNLLDNSQILSQGELFVEIDSSTDPNNIRLKIGDGVTEYSELDYIDSDFDPENIDVVIDTSSTYADALNNIVSGKSLDSLFGAVKRAIQLKSFSTDALLSTVITDIVLANNVLTVTFGDGTTKAFNVVGTTYSTGTATTSGITKLYTTSGNNKDGSMTQSAIKSYVESSILEEDTAIKELIGSINSFEISIVESLPDVGESHTIYFVPKVDSESNNSYDEYLYINDTFEKIGSTIIDLSDYSTTEQMNTAINNAIADLDLSNYSTIEQMNAAISEAIAGIDLSSYVTNSTLANYSTTAETSVMITNAIADAISSGTIDLSAYSTTEEMNAAIATAISNIDYSNYATHQDVSDAIAGIDLSDYTTQSQLATAITEAISDLNISQYATKAEVATTISEAISEIDFSPYVTTTAMNTAIENAINDIDYSNYATKSDLDNYVENSTLSNYSTTTQMNSAITTAISDIDYSNYATKSDLDSYSTTEQMNTAISDAISDIDMSSYANKTDLDNYVENSTLSNYSTTSQMNTVIEDAIDNIDYSSYATKSDLNNYVEVSTLSNYSTTSEMNSAIATAMSDITNFEVEIVESLPATGESHTIYFVPNGESDNNIYNEYMYIDSKFELIGSTSIDLSAYSTTEEMNTAIATAISGIDLSAYVTNDTLLANYSTTSEMNTAISNAINDIDYSSYATKSDLDDYSTTSQMNTAISNAIDNIDYSNYATKSDLDDYVETSTLSNYSTTTQMNSAISDAISDIDMTSYATKTDLDDYVATSDNYIKSASVSGDTLTITKSDDSTVTFTNTDTTYNQASDSAAGIAKLYSTLGDSADGAMTQEITSAYMSAIATEVNNTYNNISLSGNTLSLSRVDETTEQINLPSAPTASSSTAGISKLYTSTGSNTDGSMDQNSITTALNGKLDKSTDSYIKSASVSGDVLTLTKEDNTSVTFTNTYPVYATGTSTTAGITKLYSSEGTNTDGSMTQAAIKTYVENAVSGGGSGGSGLTTLTKTLTAGSTSISFTDEGLTDDTFVFLDYFTSNPAIYPYNVNFNSSTNTVTLFFAPQSGNYTVGIRW